MFDRIRTMILRLHEVAEVNALSDRDLDDLGMSRHQVLDFLRMPRDINERVLAMGKIFGVPEVMLHHDHAKWVELLSICGRCTDRTACSKVLALGLSAGPDVAPFCGNRTTFVDLAHHVAQDLHCPLA